MSKILQELFIDSNSDRASYYELDLSSNNAKSEWSLIYVLPSY